MAKLKLRKMLGQVEAPYLLRLMKLMETQSKETLASWCLGYAQQEMLPIYERRCPQDQRPRAALEAAWQCLEGKQTVRETKQMAQQVTQASRDCEGDPAAQAAARSVAAAIGSLYTRTNPLGMTFYAAAASVYDREGLQKTAEEYDELAAGEFDAMYRALERIAVEGEPNPAKLKWDCSSK